jgi:hypothetical protein
VQKDRPKEEEARENPDGVMLDHCPLGMLQGEPGCERKSDQKKDDKPGIVNADIDPSNCRQFHGLSDHRVPLAFSKKWSVICLQDSYLPGKELLFTFECRTH